MITIFKNHISILNSRLEEIEKYIFLIEKQKDVISEMKISSEDNKAILNKTHEYVDMLISLKNSTINYNAIIISLYGCYENFIDDILKEYLSEIIKIDSKYNSLNSEIKKKYMEKATEYLANPQRFINYGMSVEDLVESLYQCIKEDNCQKMNLDLVLKHPANLKIEQVNTLLMEIGINNPIKNIIKSDKYKDYYRNEKDIVETYNDEDDIVEKNNEILFSTLIELVDRRNSVAHSWKEDERISLKEINKRFVVFIKMFCGCIYELVVTTYMLKLKECEKLSEFKIIYNVFNNKILCVNGETSRLKKGDNLLVYNQNINRWYTTEVKKIQVNSKEVDKIEQDNIDIGLELFSKVKKDYKFYYIKN